MTLDEAVTLFLAAKRARGLSERTLRWYMDQIQKFMRWLPMSEWFGPAWFRPETIEAYLEHERRRGLSDATIAGAYRALHAVFLWLRKRHHLPKDMELPTELMEAPKVARTEKEHVTAAEFRRLLDSIGAGDPPTLNWINRRDRLAVATLFLTGLRRQEVINLHVGDYDLADACVHVRRGKGGNDRYVPLLAPVATEFVAYVYVRPPWSTPHVFLAACNGLPDGVLTGNGLYQRLRYLCRKAGLRALNPHAFRHGLAVYLLNERGAQMSLIQKILGHQTLSTTSEVYARWQRSGVQRQYLALMDGAMTVWPLLVYVLAWLH
jgi:integrase/recombinase XerC